MTASSYYKNRLKQEAAHPVVEIGQTASKKSKTTKLPLRQLHRIMVTPQAASNQAIAIKPEYTNYSIVAQVLTRDGFDQEIITPDQITGHSLQSLEFGIIWYQVGSGAIPISTDQFNQYWGDIQATKPQSEPEYSITFTYTREDNVSVDVVMVANGNELDCRHCWIEETLDDHVYCLETRNGTVVKSHWKNSWNNKWLKAYRKLWTERNHERVTKLEAIARQETDLEEIEYIRSLEAAMYA